MTQQPQRAEITTKRILYPIPEPSRIRITRDIPYEGADAARLGLDLYRPPAEEPEGLRPAILFVSGYSDTGMKRILGCAAKEMESYISWAQLVASAGIVGVTFAAIRPEEDAIAAFDHVVKNAGVLGIDEKRIGIWACSGNSPNALGLLMRRPGHVRCAAMSYGYMLDLADSKAVESAAGTFRFVNPCHGRTISDIPRVPLMIARAGKDEMPGLNISIDNFVREAIAGDLPVIVQNCAGAPHAFDLLHDAPVTRLTISMVLRFLRANLVETD